MIKKATLRIPTKEQYAYIEVELEDSAGDLLDADILEKYQELTSMILNGDNAGGLTHKDWVRVRDNFVMHGKIEIEDFEMAQLSPLQKWFINEVKKVHARAGK